MTTSTTPGPTPAPPPAPAVEHPARTTRRRAETRGRLLAAALEVLSEQGLQRSSVELVCERAGYTRGAFYSNFATMDDVVAALYAQQADLVLDHVEERLGGDELRGDLTAARVEDVVARVLELLPADRQWHAIRTEFTAQALRNPDAAAVIAEQRRQLRERLAPLLAAALERAGRRLTAPACEVARAVVAAHEGAVIPRLLGDDPAEPGFEARLVAAVLTAATAPTTAPATGEARR